MSWKINHDEKYSNFLTRYMSHNKTPQHSCLGMRKAQFSDLNWKIYFAFSEGRITLQKSCTPLSKILLLSRKICKKSLKIPLFWKISYTFSEEWYTPRHSVCNEDIWVVLIMILLKFQYTSAFSVPRISNVTSNHIHNVSSSLIHTIP